MTIGGWGIQEDVCCLPAISSSSLHSFCLRAATCRTLTRPADAMIKAVAGCQAQYRRAGQNSAHSSYGGYYPGMARTAIELPWTALWQNGRPHNQMDSPSHSVSVDGKEGNANGLCGPFDNEAFGGKDPYSPMRLTMGNDKAKVFLIWSSCWSGGSM